MVNTRWNAIRSWWWHGHCLLCRAATTVDGALCHGCFADLPWLDAACPVCAAPLPYATGDTACGKCQQRQPPFHAARAALHYGAPVDDLILGLKYGGRLELARGLGQLLAERLRTMTGADESAWPDVIVPVPLHRGRLRERGYNQSLEIARALGRRLALPVAPTAAQRVRVTAPQTRLAPGQRARNVRNAFSVIGDVAGKHVAIVDDVMTSGHTAGALARALRRAGANRVSVWVVARA